ncbi:MAG: chemotaxis protein CheB [Candidatus Methylacidiphilales bacterium]|nr:chemotaxis protein CheB [Candidatus Methylacidiphilales bacterium]
MGKRKSEQTKDAEKMAARKATHDVQPAESGGPLRGSEVQIVGIGCSAGGLEALETFLEKVPPDTDLAFVVIQHMDPTKKGFLVELLQRRTTLPVTEIRDRVKVQPHHVYVIPPNRDVAVVHGVLHLLEPEAPRGFRLPIDFFFRSLASDQKYRSIGVILSGMASDGTLGLRSIKEQAGAGFAQDPATALFDSMPRSAIAAGLIDVVAPATDLPARILDYLKRPPSSFQSPSDIPDGDESSLEKIFILLRAHTGHDFSPYKRTTVHRRVEKRIRLHQIGTIEDYVTYLQNNVHEVELLFKDLLIGVSNFFRDSDIWKCLEEEILPDYLASRPDGAALRAWTVGCSTGEEAYSLAILFKETLAALNPPKKLSLHIFATDVDKDSIERARTGSFGPNIGADVSEERLQRFFNDNGQGHYVIKQEIRDMITFAPQNVMKHPPITRLDIVTCRNLLIYMDKQLSENLLSLFHHSLIPDGLLVLGSAETIDGATRLFSPLEEKQRIYKRLNTASHYNNVRLPYSFAPLSSPVLPKASSRNELASGKASPSSLVEKILLNRYSPAAVLVTHKGEILYISGKTGKYLEPPSGKADFNLFAMARTGLKDVLARAIDQAIKEKNAIAINSVTVETNNGNQIIDLSIEPVDKANDPDDLILITFKDVDVETDNKASRGGGHKSLTSKSRQLISKQHPGGNQNVETARSEMQRSLEELRFVNVELQSMNEELQSVNEELTTSKEELQSMNEELRTVNYELQAKVNEFSCTSNDMYNLLNHTDVAALFLDESLLVKRFTIQTSKIIKLIPSDVGRPITDIVSTLNYPQLADDAREVLRSLTCIEKHVTSENGLWFNVRIVPYRTAENQVRGVIITFADITEFKSMMQSLQKALKSKELHAHHLYEENVQSPSNNGR